MFDELLEYVTTTKDFAGRSFYMSKTDTAQPRVLIDLINQSITRDLILVAGFAGLVGFFAQLSIRLPFTPVPITGQTFAILLGASILGPGRAILGSGLYLGVGLLGVPWFAGGTGGVEVASAPSFGYLVGFVVASGLVGLLARHGLDRSPFGSVVEMISGNLVIYALGLSWLAVTLHVSFAKAVALGATPFLLGDALKILLAATLLPAAWKISTRFAGSE